MKRLAPWTPGCHAMLNDHWVEILAYTGEREVLVYDYWAREYKTVDHNELQEAAVPWPGKKNLNYEPK